ncbi:hypothetical protein [Streptomyces lacrimifluminis]|uniref:hypothetical protein n=1 Tax=Streptomyces lacrimifluminis TaxID=1500077 RepID=UPI001667A76F|nr:hypothetical protein [Streptomyces lacrimifluminis]
MDDSYSDVTGEPAEVIHWLPNQPGHHGAAEAVGGWSGGRALTSSPGMPVQGCACAVRVLGVRTVGARPVVQVAGGPRREMVRAVSWPSFVDSHIFWPRGVWTMLGFALGFALLAWGTGRSAPTGEAGLLPRRRADDHVTGG